MTRILVGIFLFNINDVASSIANQGLLVGTDPGSQLVLASYPQFILIVEFVTTVPGCGQGVQKDSGIREMSFLLGNGEDAKSKPTRIFHTKLELVVSRNVNTNLGLSKL